MKERSWRASPPERHSFASALCWQTATGWPGCREKQNPIRNTNSLAGVSQVFRGFSDPSAFSLSFATSASSGNWAAFASCSNLLAGDWWNFEEINQKSQWLRPNHSGNIFTPVGTYMSRHFILPEHWVINNSQQSLQALRRAVRTQHLMYK